MKKIYLIATTMVFGSVAFGQIHQNMPVEEAYESLGEQKDKVFTNQVYNFGKAPGDAIFTEDFDGDMGAFTVGAGTMDTIWKFDTNGPDGDFDSPNDGDVIGSTTAANGFMIFDADLSNVGNSPFINRVGALTSPVIDMTGITNAIVSFESRYRTCCANAFFLKVEVSTDDFATSQTYDASRVGQSVNSDLGTFVTKLNVSDFLATAANLNNFKFRFFFDGDEGGNTSHYFWQVDDVNVYENWTDDNTLVEHFMEAGTFGIPYYNMTLNQISPISFGGAIRNDGTADAAGTILTTSITNGATASTASTPYSSVVGALDTVFTAAWTPTATGVVVYDFSHEISATNPDGNTADNIITDAMNITTNLYSVGNGINGGTFTNLASQPGQAIACGNIMEIIADDYIVGMEIDLSSTASNVGQLIKGEIWKFDVNADDYVYLTETEEVEIGTSSQPNPNNSTLSLTFPAGPVQIFANDDLLVMQSNYSGVSVRTAQRVQPGVVAGVSTTGTFSLANPRAIRVRLNTNPSASLEDVTGNVSFGSISPNPTKNVSVLKFNTRNSQDITIQVVDVTGKVMQTEALGTVAAGGHTVNINSAEFNAGVYFVNIVSNDGVVTEKLIKK